MSHREPVIVNSDKPFKTEWIVSWWKFSLKPEPDGETFDIVQESYYDTAHEAFASMRGEGTPTDIATFSVRYADGPAVIESTAYGLDLENKYGYEIPEAIDKEYREAYRNRHEWSRS